MEVSTLVARLGMYKRGSCAYKRERVIKRHFLISASWSRKESYNGGRQIKILAKIYKTEMLGICATLYIQNF